MRNILVTSLIILASMLITLSAEAKSVDYNNVFPHVKKYVLTHYKPMYDGEIGVKCDRIPGAPFNVPDGKLEIKVKGSLRDQFVQRSVVNVAIYVDGQFKRAVGVPVELSLYENVWVATQPIKKDEALTFANAALSRRDISKIARTAARASNDLSEKRVMKDFRAGEILDHNFIKDTPIVVKNSIVEVVFKSEKVAVTIPCEAMQNGGLGDLVRVKSKDYNKQYIGKVIAKNYIQVNI